MIAVASVAPRTWGIHEPWVEIEVPIRYRKREGRMGYYVERADNGHTLGMIAHFPGDTTWRAMLLNEAFHPADADVLTRTAKHPMFPGQEFQGYRIEETDTRAEAASAIVSALASRSAEAVEDLVQAARAPFLATREAV